MLRSSLMRVELDKSFLALMNPHLSSSSAGFLFLRNVYLKPLCLFFLLFSSYLFKFCKGLY